MTLRGRRSRKDAGTRRIPGGSSPENFRVKQAVAQRIPHFITKFRKHAPHVLVPDVYEAPETANTVLASTRRGKTPAPKESPGGSSHENFRVKQAVAQRIPHFIAKFRKHAPHVLVPNIDEAPETADIVLASRRLRKPPAPKESPAGAHTRISV